MRFVKPAKPDVTPFSLYTVSTSVLPSVYASSLSIISSPPGPDQLSPSLPSQPLPPCATALSLFSDNFVSYAISSSCSSSTYQLHLTSLSMMAKISWRPSRARARLTALEWASMAKNSSLHERWKKIWPFWNVDHQHPPGHRVTITANHGRSRFTLTPSPLSFTPRICLYTPWIVRFEFVPAKSPFAREKKRNGRDQRWIRPACSSP